MLQKKTLKEQNPNWPQIPDQTDQNTDNWWLWIAKNKCIISCNKSSTKHEQNLFIY